MAQVAIITHEGNNFDEYTGTVNVADLAINSTSPLVGTYDLAVTIDGNLDLTYGYLNTSLSTNVCRLGFRLRLNSLSMNAGDELGCGAAVHCNGSYANWAIGINFQYNTDHYEMKARGYNDEGGVSDTDWRTISGTDPICFEVRLTREVSDGSNDGTMTLYIDEDDTGTNPTNIGNYNNFQTVDALRVGANYLPDATVTGTIYIDQIIFRDDDTPIGCSGEALSIEISRETTLQRGVRIYP